VATAAFASSIVDDQDDIRGWRARHPWTAGATWRRRRRAKPPASGREFDLMLLDINVPG
jgi:hypothetical protein